MPAPEAFAYPLLLAATCAIYRVGRRDGEGRVSAFEWARLGVLAAILGLVVALQVRFAASGQLLSPVAMGAAVLSIVAIMGLVGLNVITIVDTWPRAGPDESY